MRKGRGAWSGGRVQQHHPRGLEAGSVDAGDEWRVGIHGDMRRFLSRCGRGCRRILWSGRRRRRRGWIATSPLLVSRGEVVEVCCCEGSDDGGGKEGSCDAVVNACAKMLQGINSKVAIVVAGEGTEALFSCGEIWGRWGPDGQCWLVKDHSRRIHLWIRLTDKGDR